MLIKTKTVEINKQLSIGGNSPFFLIAGPCVIESEEHVLKMAERIKTITDKLSITYIFKSSYDKANRSSINSYRGPGMETGLKILEKVKKEMDVPVISDVHSIEQVKPAAEVLDIIQVPAFLSRQTDLLIAVGETDKVANIKKGQFLSPWDTENIISKIESTGNKRIILTERGASFGYNHLIVDMKSFPVMRSFGYPVVYDVTHSVQLPGGKGTSSGGLGEFIEPLARAGVATGIDGIFMEVHDCPEDAMCDGPNSLPLGKLENLLVILKDIDSIVKN
jgi:2-dehydro-3-deoxyphosphooctonate aldolase (KDO 8-P synthase)